MTLLIAERNRLMACIWSLTPAERVAARRRIAQIDAAYSFLK